MRRSLVMAMLLWPSFSVAMGQAPAPPAPAPPAPPPAPAPRLVVPEEMAAYRLIAVRVEGVFDSAAIVVEPDELADVKPDDDGKGAVFIGPPGRYVIRAVVLDGKQLRWLRAVVTVGDPDKPKPPKPKPPKPPKPDPPKPSPDPPQPPPPAPAPIAGRMHVIFVMNAGDAKTMGEAALEVSAAIRAAQADLDFRWEPHEAGTAAVRDLNLAPIVADAGTPCVLILSSPAADGYSRIVDRVKAPTEASVLAAIRKARGK